MKCLNYTILFKLIIIIIFQKKVLSIFGDRAYRVEEFSHLKP